MTSTWFFMVCGFAVIACGLVAGVFLSFSDFVMRSLDRADPTAGVEVMQAINREVFKSLFMVLLLGLTALSPLLMGYAYLQLAGPASVAIMTGGALYLAGVFAVTLVFNVPMNNRLAAKDHAGAEAATYWTQTYRPRWTFWNGVRALASAASAFCYLLACLWLAQGA